MQFKGPEYGCPEPAVYVDVGAPPEQGGLPVGTHEGNPYDTETGMLSTSSNPGEADPAIRYRKWLETMTPHEARQYEERMRRLTEFYQGPGGP